MSTMIISLPGSLKAFVERADHIDVWRVLHGQRDVAARMWEPDAL